ncbi:hypothetical protein HRD49_42730 [Corallococcus exiguus]|uniref:Type III secretion protein n=1 Tax=Corallococcus exiguus TaxID=83462 RepID=A0A7X4YCM4_9BACT|nr:MULTISPECIES: hypothetical protein [Corallococcus]RKI32019.1 hypothetical protein D7Y27_36555 [Corallococcus sp. AB004]NBC42999.1 hypothetical protein [Corallococcus exiguus]NNC22427.1 hypothetical protein [Corallococcus exiguus]NPC75433.1 hypothetical protein [Corallococcus exiguus]NPD29244.1 hypothetical protein [Corallococcus exiguus]
MSKIDSGMMGPNLRMNTQMTTARQTPNTSFGARVQNGLNSTVGAVGAGVGAVAGFVPGAGIVSAAVSSAQTFSGASGSGMQGGPYVGVMNTGSGAVPSTNLPGVGGSGLPSTGGSTSLGTSVGTSSGGSVGDQLNTNGSLKSMMDDNVKLLNMQSAMQHESQLFTAVSNVMKSRHDTTKNSIGNIR